MKVETRTITVEQDVYIAEDGMQFTDKYDCIKHEYEILEKRLKFYDHKFQKTDFESCTYVDLKTDTDVDAFERISEYLGITRKGINGVGLYMWWDNRREDTWLNLTEAMAKLSEDEKEDEE